ncbi:MAG: 30S ribosomal protein S2 [candidate division WWE3 bacterium GW2011_GWF2_41_45]|uniref:Small ribosomal subunit protein uS2 n=2 Tax=Katanobacteria TaxID=422282 RepID=A0A1F4W226_UNCKA|nr:MAG: 30S ribosomal protein S2 [candidate division WWE3 bacterium GW2011_GWC2_41_23]KKS10147.1 MAG: 30S ribosomal protein S2 [candidate division WWE3 bacterium GW2011_GWF2_41_45]KKS19928.1 MAG: 30S ribosomal protein S2 [candidate division WWE3 bacterium GW2011_GWE1_41_72]KKS28242.1 MAG: 30S ribosomal protein S2 [candidate division WWE3 bacterium GW2011_GWC1_42_102]KKS28990.1 MAG: 30S ribosomal protein S2 [candidate division WWE3 bacterium GW2011_GWD2_42_11]KKS50586.1 MAG: 30S ribosomal prote
MSKYKVPKIEDLIEAGVHFGHQIRRWHPKMEPYIYTVSKNIHIIDLEDTERLLKEACEFLNKMASEGKKIVFVGTKKQSKDIIKSEATRSGAMFVNERWIGGTITNFPTIKKNLDKLIKYIRGKETGEFDKYTKKERLLIDRETDKMNLVYGGILSLAETPDVLFVIDPKRERTAVKESQNAGIPVVAIVDTNADPTGIDYIIPGNDDAIKSVALLVRAIADAVEEGYKDFDKKGADQSKKDAKKAEPVSEDKDDMVVTTTESPVVTAEVEEIEEKLVVEVVEPKKIEKIEEKVEEKKEETKTPKKAKSKKA